MSATASRNQVSVSVAVDNATAAIEAERTGHLGDAMSLYRSAAAGLIAAAKTETNAARRAQLQLSAGDALTAAERVQVALKDQNSLYAQQPTSVSAHQRHLSQLDMTGEASAGVVRQTSFARSAGSSASTASAPSAVSTPPATPTEQLFVAAAKASETLSRPENEGLRGVLATVASGVMTAAQKAYELDQEYQIRQKVTAGLGAGLAKARELEQQYAIRQKLVSAVHSAKDLDAKHDIRQKVGDVATAAGKAVLTGVDMAREADRTYQIHERVGEGLRDGYSKAKQVNEEYQIADRVAAGARSAFERAQELNSQYKVTDKLGDAALSGLSSLATVARRASQSLDEKRSEVSKRQP